MSSAEQKAKLTPIAMDLHEIQAILAGEKKQFRLPLKNQPDYFVDAEGNCVDPRNHQDSLTAMQAGCEIPIETTLGDLGDVGDELWVKENYYLPTKYDGFRPKQVPDDTAIWYEGDKKSNGGLSVYHFGRLRQKRFMPQKFSRIRLKITHRSIEKLQDIDEQGALAEGCNPYSQDFINNLKNKDLYSKDMHRYTAKKEFLFNWAYKYGKTRYQWKNNPWVLLYEVEKI